MANVVPIPEFNVFEAMPFEEQRAILLTLREHYTNTEIKQAWGMHNNKYSKFIAQFELPEKPRVLRKKEKETDVVGISGSAPAVKRDAEPKTSTTPVEEKKTIKSPNSPSVLQHPAIRDFVQDNTEESKALVQKDLQRESNVSANIDATQGQVFEFVKICGTIELARKLQGIIALVEGDENNFNVSIHIEEIIPINKTK